ncbi:carbonic anhydrase [Aspergillus carlsbadensis]|nr:carbonic anhydrase [Aspergillus carlsbadensis]
MDSSRSIEDLLQRNAKRVETFEPIPSLSEISNLPPEQSLPMPKIFIVSCCDPRVDPWDILGLEKWDAVVTRGAAGRMASQFSNLLFLDHVLNFTDIMIIHHTDCSAQLFGNEGVCQVLAERAPDATREVESLRLPGFEDLERSVQEDVQLVKSSQLVRRELAERTRGFVYDLTTGEVRPVPDAISAA